MIGLVYDNDGWILERVAAGLEKDPIFHEGFNAHDNQTAVGIYLPYYLLAGDPQPPRGKRTVALFTHREKGLTEYAERKRQWWDRAAGIADLCWAMSEQSAETLPSSKTFVLEIPPAEEFALRRRLRLGVIGHDQPGNRKRTDLIDVIGDIPGVEVYFTNGRVPQRDMPDLYREMDYILVLGQAEGGPMCVKEAIEMGRPVIAPDVGWCWDYPVVRYSGDQELLGIIQKLAPSSPESRWAEFRRELKRQVL